MKDIFQFWFCAARSGCDQSDCRTESTYIMGILRRLHDSGSFSMLQIEEAIQHLSYRLGVLEASNKAQIGLLYESHNTHVYCTFNGTKPNFLFY